MQQPRNYETPVTRAAVRPVFVSGVAGQTPRAPVTFVTRGQIELQQSTANLISLPILIAVALLAAIIRQLFVHPPSATILGVCAAAVALGILLAVYLLRNMGSTLVVSG